MTDSIFKDNLFDGKKVFITGGATGMGLGFAQAFLNHGAKVIIASRKEDKLKEEKLFTYLVNTFQSSAWIALGKMKNPMTNKTEINLEQASYYIDLLNMLQVKTKNNLTQYEEQMLINIVSELKMNFIQEKKKTDE